MTKKIAIIGAGVAGLTTLKACLHEGLTPVLFERSNLIGGIWNYDPKQKDGGGPAYESLHTNTSKQMTGFSDFRFPSDYPDFPSQKQVLNYLNEYALRFSLNEHIRFGHSIINVNQAGVSWELTIKHHQDEFTQEFDALIVCSGRHEHKHVPHIHNIESFEGKAIHSYSYKNAEPLKGQNILVVGSGSSAIDIAVEASDIAKKVYLSINSGSWIIPKTIDGKPYDHNIKRFNSFIPKKQREKFLLQLLTKEYKKLEFDQNNEGWSKLFPEFSLEKARITPNSIIFDKLKQEKIVVKSKVDKTEGNIIKFIDESKEWIDTIIFATGYKIDFPFLNHHFIGLDDNAIGLHRHIFSIDHPNLAFVGMCNVAGPIMPLIEMQGKYVAKLYGKKVQLPGKEKMRSQIQKHFTTCRKKGIDPMKVQTLDYLTLLAKDLKLGPSPFQKLIQARNLLFEPFTVERFKEI